MLGKKSRDPTRYDRDGRIRTYGLSVPNRAHYQAVLHPDDKKSSQEKEIISDRQHETTLKLKAAHAQ